MSLSTLTLCKCQSVQNIKKQLQIINVSNRKSVLQWHIKTKHKTQCCIRMSMNIKAKGKNNSGLPIKDQISSVGTPGPAVVMYVTQYSYCNG
jgi:hypothetical protein